MDYELGYDFTRQDVDAIGSFLSLAWYNGYEESVKDIMKVLNTAFKFDVDNKYKAIFRPEQWGYETDNFGAIFWSWLVLQYGDYGTSPRFGWLYPENSRRLYTIMSELLEDT